MTADGAAPMDPIETLKTAFHADDAGAVRTLLDQHPQFKAMIDRPVGPFNSPAIVHVRSRGMLDALLEAGANIDARSNWWAGGFGLLDSAPVEIARYALERGATLTPHAAARLGMLDELKGMVARDPGVVHERGGDGQLPLHFASSVEVAEVLLDNGADIDARDIDHESTAAQWMIDERQAIARYLVSRGANTDLLMATALGDAGLVLKLLDDDPDSIRMTVSDEYFPMVGGKAGGTIYQWTLGWYVRAHQVARKFGHTEVLKMLLESSPTPVKLVDACWSNDGDAVRAILAEDPHVLDDLTDEDRRHVAHAARNNETEAVRLMLECGFPVDATSQHKGMPLHWAAFHGNADMTRDILKHSPPLEALDADHHATPLGWAIYGSEHGWYRGTGDYAGTVEALIGAGVTIPAEPAGSPAVQEVMSQHIP